MEIEQARQEIEAALEAIMPPAEGPAATLHAAMRWAVASGGKRVRPLRLRAPPPSRAGRNFQRTKLSPSASPPLTAARRGAWSSRELVCLSVPRNVGTRDRPNVLSRPEHDLAQHAKCASRQVVCIGGGMPRPRTTPLPSILWTPHKRHGQTHAAQRPGSICCKNRCAVARPRGP